MTTEELLIFFMGKDISSIEKSEHAANNLHLFKLAREYLEILDYIFDKKEQKKDPESYKAKLEHKGQIEFYINATYNLDISEIGKRCLKANRDLRYTSGPQKEKESTTESEKSDEVVKKQERNVSDGDFLTVEELIKRRDHALTEYLDYYHADLSQISLCLYVRLSPNGHEEFTSYNDVEQAINIMRELYKNGIAEEVVIGLSITRLDMVETSNDQQKILGSCYLPN